MPEVYHKKHPEQEETGDGGEDDLKLNPVRTLMEWDAPSRPFKKKSKSYYSTIAIIVTLVILIALVAQQYILIAALLALAFVAYVLGVVPPENVKYKISTQGITIGDHFYFWLDLDSFWFDQKEGFRILHILTRLRFPAQLMLLLGDQDEEKVKETAARYLPYHEIVPKSFIDKWSDKLQKYFPLEASHH